MAAGSDPPWAKRAGTAASTTGGGADAEAKKGKRGPGLVRFETVPLLGLAVAGGYALWRWLERQRRYPGRGRRLGGKRKGKGKGLRRGFLGNAAGPKPGPPAKPQPGWTGGKGKTGKRKDPKKQRREEKKKAKKAEKKQAKKDAVLAKDVHSLPPALQHKMQNRGGPKEVELTEEEQRERETVTWNFTYQTTKRDKDIRDRTAAVRGAMKKPSAAK